MYACTCTILLLLTLTVVSGVVYNLDKPLREFPMVMSHDAATSMLDVKLNVVGAYTQTQADGELFSQLDCGARAYDYRPYLKKDGSLIAHHGSIKVESAMRGSVQGVMDWLAKPAHSNELVVLYVSHCLADGDDATQEARCIEAAAALLAEMGVSSIRGDCSPLSSLTVGEALERGKLPQGGSLLAIFDCTNENFVQSVNCWGVHDKREYCCYGKRKEVAWSALTSYLNSTASPLATAADNLWVMQAHWQSSAVSVPLGDLHRSSVLKDENKAQVNAWLAQALRDKAFPFKTLNLVELDNVCDGGLEVLAALQENYYV